MRRVRLHRLKYCQAKGIKLEDIVGLVVRHTCDNPRCINPRHLVIGTAADNSADMVHRGRSLKGTRHHKARLDEQKVADIRARYVRDTNPTHGAMPWHFVRSTVYLLATSLK